MVVEEKKICDDCAYIETCGGKKEETCFEFATPEEHAKGMQRAMYLDNISMHRPR